MPELFHITTEANSHDETKHIATTHVKVLVLGAAGVGKTSLIEKYLDKSVKIDPQYYDPTVGVDSYFYQFNIGNRPIKLTIVDTGIGRPQLLMPHYAGAGVVLLCYDRTNLQSLNMIEEYLQQIRYCMPASINSGAKLILVETKADCVKAQGIDAKLAALCKAHNLIGAKEVSAKTCEVLNGVFSAELAELIANAESKARDAEYVAEFITRYEKVYSAGFFSNRFTAIMPHIRNGTLTKDIILDHAKADSQSRTATIVNVMQQPQPQANVIGMTMISGLGNAASS